MKTICRVRSGQSLAELAAGLMILVPVFLLVFDLAVCIIADTINENVCRDAARAASAGVPAPFTSFNGTTIPADAFQRAQAVVKHVYQLDDSRRVGQAFGRLQASGVKQSSEVMGDSEHDGLHGAAFAGSVTETVQHDTQGTDTACELTGTDTAGELADTNKPGSQGRDSGIMSERAVQWPARPGSPQYDWEEPRVTEPGLGRAVDGISSRVDRLRLLGNGVVPQQAARAYTILKERLTRQSEVTNG